MALAIKPTTPITGKEAEKLLESLKNVATLRKDELKFKLKPEFFNKIKES